MNAPTTMTAAPDLVELTLGTYALLETRLRRLEYVIGGGIDGPVDRPSIPDRLGALEASVNRLVGSMPALAGLVKLHRDHPEYFDKPAAALGQELPDRTDRPDPVTAANIVLAAGPGKIESTSALSPSSSPPPQLSLSKSTTPSFFATASNLALVHAAVKTPDRAELVGQSETKELVDLVAAAAARQLGSPSGEVDVQIAQLERDVATVRARQAVLMKRWHDVGVVGAGACVVGWDESLRRIEGTVRRRERADD